MIRTWKFALTALMSLALAMPLAAQDDNSGPLFMKHLVDEGDFFEPWGIGLDFFTMDQQYDISSLQFQLPGVALPDPSLLEIDNNVDHLDIKFDVWLTPFLNLFAIIGHVEAETIVDFSKAPITGLPVPLTQLPISYDGTVYGGGATLVYGSENWFTSLTTTWTDTDLGGQFESSVSSFSAQPRLGLVRDKWQFWVGGMYLDTEEDHRGTIQLPIPGVPPVPFSVELETSDEWNYAVGVSHVFSSRAHVSLEIGTGDRDHTLFNYTLRF